MRTKPTLEPADAAPIANACADAARALGVAVSIAVADEAGFLVSFTRLDGAKAHTVDLALRKVRTSTMLGLPTAVLETMAREGRLLNNEALALGGGRPVTHAEQCAGAVGLSGSTSEIDDRITAHGLEAWATTPGADQSGDCTEPFAVQGHKE